MQLYHQRISRLLTYPTPITGITISTTRAWIDALFILIETTFFNSRI